MKTPPREHPPAGNQASPSEGAINDLMAAWWAATQAMKRHLTPVLEREHGLDFKDYLALSAVETGANYPGLVCGRLAMTPSMVSRLIDDLVKSGLIVRRLDLDDSRRVQLTLTSAGAAVLAATRHTMYEVLRGGLSGLPATQVVAFTEIMRLLGTSFSQSGSTPSDPALSAPALEIDHP
ncbi:winged helix-turn-helix transcriptional regulator [Deinococcus sp. KSM4-11]|uniref:MarR family winged helix-turn-helix transcriptional regulator n=1 Tax=Deinococcus sp. KSM4-11 TaxID=2568654 RepID=UPI0010A31668|nr:MarR family winged helix-turn-helix transcriptional regulator [Deinococcus sp. KSM4-11]THF84299.1 winged helix-turn-helix transcriptional regulator [Deinococcus sp. KSM4-11]